ncbi:GspH/FimT family pseudopilin [Marinobacter confluentis]|uniref:Type II secretion system protein H n=2 Tax=Marinobacter confluentis TaxID=1697557 RepID=A0A4Z1C116_9GAMM|nr:GspH/FimT family protein [Marinobacter confluentis]TGN38599.1 prepilin-type N-terminal cleavage/methylation domain-containing protein [Marinobacter confluentis]
MIPKRLKQSGFTLLELMITITIAVIIASAATAGWQSLIESTSSQRVRSTLVNSFADARSHAVTQNQTTTLCPLDANQVCTANWNQPISVFLDPNNDRAITSDTEILSVHHPIPNGSLTASKSGPAERRYFQYNPDGTAKGTIGNIVWCPEDGNASLAIQLRMNFGGRITWALDQDNDGIREDAQGQALACS